MKFTRTLAVASVALGMALVSGGASAGLTYSLTSGGSSSSNTYGNTRTFYDTDPQNADPKVADPKVKVSAWSNDSRNNHNVSNGKIRSAYLGQYSGGLGVCNRSESSSATNCSNPSHTVDNSSPYTLDSVLLTFTGDVNLASLTTGYIANFAGDTRASKGADGDFSVLYYKGTAPVTTLANLTYAIMLSSGDWGVFGNYNAGLGQTTFSGNSGSIGDSSSIFSKYWLVAAYNPLFGGGADAGNDYFKISSFIVNVPEPTSHSPEPATLSLLGLGLAGIGFMRRRRK